MSWQYLPSLMMRRRNKDFLCLVTTYKKLFDQKELQIKMSSSLLNVSNDASGRPEEFKLNDI